MVYRQKKREKSFVYSGCVRVLHRERRERKLAIIRKIVYSRIKLLTRLEILSMNKRACIYDDNFKAKILFSCCIPVKYRRYLGH